MNEATEPRSQCGICSKVWRNSQLKEVENLVDRVSPGEPMPSGQCPDEECKGLCLPGVLPLRETRVNILVDALANEYGDISVFPTRTPHDSRWLSVWKSARKINDWDDEEIIEFLSHDKVSFASAMVRTPPNNGEGFVMTPLYVVDLDTGDVSPVMSQTTYWIGGVEEDMQLDTWAEKNE